MPLFDHFRSPLVDVRPWGSFHATWCGSIANHLNESLLSPDFIALEYANNEDGLRRAVEISEDPGAVLAVLELTRLANRFTLAAD